MGLCNPVSAISGNGFGASHGWEYRGTSAGRASQYVCRDCGALFYHHYQTTPDIFEAMADPRWNIKDQCAGPTTPTQIEGEREE